MKRRNVYLDQLGLSRDDCCGNFIHEKKIRRFVERRKCGFDYRNVFNVDIDFAEWLYSHMKMYLEHNVHDLSFNNIEFEGKTYTLGEAIDRIIEITGDYLKAKDSSRSALTFEEEKEYDEKLIFAGRLFLEIMGYLWL